MSPNNPSNFVSDLVEMAKAFEELPRVKADYEEAQTRIEAQGQIIANREETILRLKAEIETLNSRIRTLEVDRDHAETMFLEADERTSRALDFIKATFGNAGSLIQALEPLKPEPVAAPTVVTDGVMTHSPAMDDHPQGESASPLSEQSPSTTFNPATDAATQATADAMSHTANKMTSPAPEVAAQPDPISSDASSTNSTLAQNVLSEDSAQSSPGDQPFSMLAQSKPYAGKTWTQAKYDPNFTYPDKEEWLAGGGTLDNYYT